MSAQVQTYPRPQEFLRSLAIDQVTAAKDQGKTFTRWMEEQPGLASAEYKDGMDALERMLFVANIRVNSVEDDGVWADEVGAFAKDRATKALFAEYCGRIYRKVSLAHMRAYTSSDNTVNSLARPYADNLTPRTDLMIAPAIPLSELIAVTTPIKGSDYRSQYLVNETGQQRLVRVGETAPLPKAKLRTADHTVTMYKFGRSLEASYESLRRMRIDRLAQHLQKIAAQTESDQVAAALDVLVNGDGNSNTAAEVHNNTTLDPGATAGTLRLQGWLAFKMKFVSPYMLTTALMREDVALQLALLNAGSANVPLMGLSLGGMVQNLTPINMTSDGVCYGWTADAPSLKIVGFDKRYALERVVEIGSEIQEAFRWIDRQVEELTMSMNEGYGVIDPGAALILDVNA